MSDIQMASVSKALDPLHWRLRQGLTYFERNFPEQFAEITATWMFPLYLDPTGRIRFHPPISMPEFDTSLLSVTVTNRPLSEIDGIPYHGDIAVRYEIPIVTLMQTCGRFCVYCITFDTDEEDESFQQLRNGYIGITKRSPVVRFKEHLTKAQKGTGSILHNAWSGLMRSQIPFHPVFRVFDMRPKTLEEVYAREELLVARHSLAPKGLNAIPGGMAGIKMMHELRLLNSANPVSIEQRDRVLAEYMVRSTAGHSKAAHFRSGHVRRLSDERTTWVRSCWVNLDPEAEAA